MDGATAIAAAVPALATAVLGYLGGRRRASGLISTTDADQLWAEAGRLRNALEEQASSLRTQLAAVRVELLQKSERIQHLEHENERLTTRVNELETREVIARRRAHAADDMED